MKKFRVHYSYLDGYQRDQDSVIVDANDSSEAELIAEGMDFDGFYVTAVVEL